MSRRDFSLAEFISVNEEINPLREEVSKLEDQINELTNGEFYGKFKRGLETYKLREFERIKKDQIYATAYRLISAVLYASATAARVKLSSSFNLLNFCPRSYNLIMNDSNKSKNSVKS